MSRVSAVHTIHGTLQQPSEAATVTRMLWWKAGGEGSSSVGTEPGLNDSHVLPTHPPHCLCACFSVSQQLSHC